MDKYIRIYFFLRIKLSILEYYSLKKEKMAVDNYERTQLWKEYTHPIIIRQSSIKAAQEFASMNELKLSLQELVALSKRFEEYFNTGNTDWVPVVEKYFKTKIKITI